MAVAWMLRVPQPHPLRTTRFGLRALRDVRVVPRRERLSACASESGRTRILVQLVSAVLASWAHHASADHFLTHRSIRIRSERILSAN